MWIEPGDTKHQALDFSGAHGHCSGTLRQSVLVRTTP